MCSKYINHSRLYSQHNWGDLYDYFISTRIFTLIINKIFIRALSTRRKMATGMHWICYSSRINSVFQIL